MIILTPEICGICFEEESLDTETATSQSAGILNEFKGIKTVNNNWIKTGFADLLPEEGEVIENPKGNGVTANIVENLSQYQGN